MNVDAMERALWEITVDRSSRAAYGNDPKATLARYGLSGDEVLTVAEGDARTLVSDGVNPMVVLGWWMTHVGRDGFLGFRRALAGEGSQT